MSKIFARFVVLFTLFFSPFLALYALAQAPAPVPAPVPAPDLGTAVTIYNAIMGKQYTLAVGMVLIAAVYFLRQFTGKIEAYPLFASYPDVTAMAITILTSLAGACGTALVAGQHISWPLIQAALGIGFAAAGGFAIAKKALNEIFPKLNLKLFPPAKPSNVVPLTPPTK